MTVSNIRRMFESSEVDGGATLIAAARSTDSSAIVSPIEEGEEGATPKVSTLGRLELTLIWTTLRREKVL